MDTILKIISGLGGLYTIFAFYEKRLDNSENRSAIAATLRKTKAERLYFHWLKICLDGLNRWFGPSRGGGASPYIRDHLTLRSLGVSITLALVYSLLLFLLAWGFGAPGSLGAAEALTSVWPWSARLLFVAGLLLWAAAIFWLLRRLGDWSVAVREWCTNRGLLWLYRLAGAAVGSGFAWWWLDGQWFGVVALGLLGGFVPLYVGAVAGAVAGAIAIAGAVAGAATAAAAFVVAGAFAVATAGTFAVGVAVAVGAGAGAVTGAIALAFTVAIAGAGAVAEAVAFAGVVAVAVAGAFAVAIVVAGAGAAAEAEAFAGAEAVVEALAIVGARAFAVAIAGAGAVTGAVAVAAALLIKGNFNVGTMSFLLFWGLLPLLNGLLDWCSWAISRGLGRHILEKPGWLRLIGHAAIDFGAALVLLSALAVLLAAVIEGLNLWAASSMGEAPLDLPLLIEQTTAAPFAPQGWWITFMLFSTLLPTAAHFLLICAHGVVSVTPQPLREWLADLAEQGENSWQRGPVAIYLALRFLLALVLLGVIGWSLWVVATALIPSLGGLLAEIALGTIEVVRALFG